MRRRKEGGKKGMGDREEDDEDACVFVLEGV